jgi:hypothetical protein
MEALIDFVATNRSAENMKLLANAYEKEKCFVNVYYVYYRMISVDPVKAKKYLHKFYSRNFDLMNANLPYPGQR